MGTVVFAAVLGGAVPWLATRFIRRYEARQGLSPKFTCDGTWYRAACAAAFALLALILGTLQPQAQQVVASLVVIALLGVIALVDLAVHRIPNNMVVALFAWAFVQSLLLGQPTLSQLLLGTLVAGGLFIVIALAGRGAMGTGDVKLAAAIGAVLGYPVALTALLIGIIAGGVAAFLLLVTRRIGRKDYMAYGPYLVLGALVMLIL